MTEKKTPHGSYDEPEPNEAKWPKRFVMKGRDPEIKRLDAPDLVFVRDDSAPFLVYTAELPLNGEKPRV